MKRSLRNRLFLLCCLMMTTSTPAWTPFTRGYMAITAYRALPADMRVALKPHRKAYRDAALATDIPADPAELVNEGCRLLSVLEQQLSGRPRFHDVAATLGRLAAVIAQMTDPFPGEETDTARDYRAYMDRKLHRFRFAYEPMTPDALGADDGCTRLFRFRHHGRGMRGLILADYARFGRSDGFDDRSAAFGTASLLFSDACCEIARTGTRLWKRAHGRITGTLLIR